MRQARVEKLTRKFEIEKSGSESNIFQKKGCPTPPKVAIVFFSLRVRGVIGMKDDEHSQPHRLRCVAVRGFRERAKNAWDFWPHLELTSLVGEYSDSNTPVKTSYGTWKWWEILRRKQLISSLKVIFGFYDQFRGCNHSDCCDFNFWRRIFLKQTHHLEWGSNIHIQVWTSRFDSLPGRRGIRWSYTGKLQHRCVLLLFFDQKNIGP